MNRSARYVIDSSVAIKWVLPEASTDRALSLRDDAERGRLELIAPDVFVPEVTNVLWRRCRLQGDISEERAHAALGELLGYLPDLVPSRELAAQALELALAFRRPTYDCLYVALALRDGATMVTADRRLLRAMGPATGRVAHVDEIDLGGGNGLTN